MMAGAQENIEVRRSANSDAPSRQRRAVVEFSLY